MTQFAAAGDSRRLRRRSQCVSHRVGESLNLQIRAIVRHRKTCDTHRAEPIRMLCRNSASSCGAASTALRAARQI